MRILAINPNTSAETTARIDRTARAAAASGTVITTRSVPQGVSLIETPEQSDFAARQVVELIKNTANDHDGFIVAAFSDPGLETARAITKKPIAGIAEAPMRRAAEMGARFAVVTVNPALADLLYGLARHYGLLDRLTEIHILEGSATQIARDYDRGLDIIVTAVEQAFEPSGVGSVILGGGPLSGLAAIVEQQVGRPVLDGVACAVRAVEQAAQ